MISVSLGFPLLLILSSLQGFLGLRSLPPMCRDGELYFRKTKMCYMPGGRGPCGELQILEQSSGDPRLGECNCHKPHCVLDRPTALIPGASRCYFLFDQGPCRRGDWLVPEGETAAKCEPIPCRREYSLQSLPVAHYGRDDVTDSTQNAQEKSQFLFSFGGWCYRTLTDKFPWCPVGQRVYFDATKDTWQFFCSQDPDSSCIVPPITNSSLLLCANGTARDQTGGCDAVIVLFNTD